MLFGKVGTPTRMKKIGQVGGARTGTTRIGSATL